MIQSLEFIQMYLLEEILIPMSALNMYPDLAEILLGHIPISDQAYLLNHEDQRLKKNHPKTLRFGVVYS